MKEAALEKHRFCLQSFVQGRVIKQPPVPVRGSLHNQVTLLLNKSEISAEILATILQIHSGVEGNKSYFDCDFTKMRI